MEQIDYSKMTDSERQQALWTYTREIFRAKARRKAYKESCAPDVPHGEYEDTMQGYKQTIADNNAEIKKLMKASA